MITGCDRIIFKGFSEKAARMIAEELNMQKPKNEIALANVIAELGATVCVTVIGDTVMVSNMTGLFDKYAEDAE